MHALRFDMNLKERPFELRSLERARAVPARPPEGPAACGADLSLAQSPRTLHRERASSPSRPHRPAGIMSDESDDVSPPTAEPLLFEILRTIETAKEMPDDCPMHLQDFFDLVSAR
jgi:hypothetical protein